MSENLDFALERLADESRPVRTTNLAALSDVSRSQIAMFHAAWAGFSPQRRLELVRELVEQGEDNIHLNFYAILRDVLFDPDAEVRRLAIEGLWEDDRSTLVGPLTTLLANDPVSEVRAAAALSLGRFVMLGTLGEISEASAEQAEQALHTAWSRPNEDLEVRRRALEGLAYTSGAEVREMIHSAYYDEEDLLRQSAVFAMGRSTDSRWARYVLDELQSPDEAMRFEAAVAAGELTLLGAATELIRLLDDTDVSVRNAAVASLGQIGGPAARRALEAVAAGEDEDLAEAADAALEELSFNSGTSDEPMFDFAQAGAASGNGAGSDGDDEDTFDVDDEDLYDEELESDEFGEVLEDDEIYDYDEEEVDWLDGGER